jgi:hypothetical protein
MTRLLKFYINGLIVINRLDFFGISFVNHFAFQLHRWRKFTGFCRPFIHQ